MKRAAVYLVAMLGSLMVAGGAEAVPITYTETGIGSGTLGATSFTNKTLTITLQGDTSNVTADGSGFQNTQITATLSIDGFAPVELYGISIETGAQYTETFNFEAIAIIGSGGGSLDGASIFLPGTAVQAYDLVSPIDVTFDGVVINSPSDGHFETSGGAFQLNNGGYVSVSFVSAPEPTSLSLVIGGCLGLIALRRGRRRRPLFPG
ncbi:PEP-CTERM sorting domain-containing protein [Rhodopila sp.]|uniref:PEP-CTERM sorting domain-containing protein n=1 Tax=Rhodopila sp. TaxID=2480087 RepID=UPI002B886A33|nr:PEP-CTERM sorting domain-containing protein [Rhodopila sp.]HVZ08186.1 PEP-CTERM sorting domain-containing protein [Rhodopila sp.]